MIVNKNGQTDQWNRIESPKINLYMITRLMIKVMLQCYGERIIFAINSARPSRKEMNLDPYLTPYTNINSRWIVNLNVKGKTIFF